ARTVAVVVPSPATSEVFDATSRTICAPVFSSLSSSSISLATVTPSLVMVGEPNFFSMTTLRPLGPSVTLTASARRLTPRNRLLRDSSPNAICFAIVLLSYVIGKSLLVCLLGLVFAGAFDDAQDVVFAHDEEFVAVEFDLGAGVLAEQHAVAFFDVE